MFAPLGALARWWTGSQSADGPEYTSQDFLVPPQSGNAWDALTLFFAMAIPFVAIQTTTHIPFPESGLHNLAIFQILVSRGLLSSEQVAETDFLFSLLLVARIWGFVLFFKKFAAKYSTGSPPPDVLRSLWPPHIRSLLYLATASIGMPVIFGIAMQYSAQHGILPDDVDIILNFGSLPIFLLSLGIWLLTEVAYGGALYAYFYRRYWRFSA